jgi:Tfp pilus assembly protein PilO
MSYTQWVQLLVPLIGIIVAIISAGLSYFFAKKLQINAEERKLKEKYYQDYINAVSKVPIDNNSEKAKDEFANAHNTLTLIGDSEVVSLAMDFHNYIKIGHSASFTIDKHDEMLTKLVKAMRKDLYSNKKINFQYPLIHLCGSGKGENHK